MNSQIATAAEEQQHVAEEINRNVVDIKSGADEISDLATDRMTMQIAYQGFQLHLPS